MGDSKPRVLNGAESTSLESDVRQPYDISFLPRNLHLFRLVHGDANVGYPSLSEDEQRLMILRITTPATLSGIRDVVGRLLNHALMGNPESIDRVGAMMPHIQELALLAGLDPPREQPITTDGPADNDPVSLGIENDRVSWDMIPEGNKS